MTSNCAGKTLTLRLLTDRAVLPHGATVSDLLSLVFKGWGACSDNWTEHHDRQDDNRIGRGSRCRVRNTDGRIRSRKQAESRDTKARLRDGDCRHSELGEAKGSNLWPCWSSWSSHQASKVSRQATTESNPAAQATTESKLAAQAESKPAAVESKPTATESKR
jgi:hypothetical protein